MGTDALYPLDWLLLALLAFGVAAGAARGFVHQFSRFLVWLFALLTAASLSPIALEFLAGKPGENVAQNVEWILSWVALPGFFLLRHWLFSWWQAIAPSGLSRLGGTLLGFLSSVLVALTLWPCLLWLYPQATLGWHPLRMAMVQVVAPGHVLPEAVRPKVIQSWTQQFEGTGTDRPLESLSLPD